MHFSVVVPVFNEKGSLRALQERLDITMQALEVDYEIIYVDDGSSDNSLDILKSLKERFPAIKIISFKENCGQSAAFWAGFKAARGDWIITLDADGQNPPEEIKRLLEFYRQFDFVTGVRKKRNDALSRKIASRIAGFWRRLVLGDATQDIGCSLRVFRRQIIDSLPFFRNFHRFFNFLVKEAGFSVKEVVVRHDRRSTGKSKYNNWQRLKEGARDLRGVSWLKKRLIKYEVKYET